MEEHESGACIYDYVDVSFDSFSWKYCGHNISKTLVSSGTSMTVRFHSDNLGAETGFLAKWEEVAGETRYYNDNTISVFYVTTKCFHS